MIAATIGRTFLKAYNEKNNSHCTPKLFFDEVFFELFYNHSKYMQWVTNSPFVQMKKGQKPDTLSKEERQEKLTDFHAKITEGCRDASIAIGFPADESSEYATTSGLVTDLLIDIKEEDIYYSWIGGGLGIGVAGGYSIYFDDASLLLDIFEGWQVYRKYLNDSVLERMRGNQINTWNGQWLTFYLGEDYFAQFDFGYLTQKEIFHADAQLVEVNTISWNELFFSVSRKYPNEVLTGYVYSLGQTNKTLGFYPFYFKEARRLFAMYVLLFGENAALQDAASYKRLYGIHIKRACELGAIGLQALEPEGLREYFKSDKMPNLKQTGNPEKDKTKEIEYKTFKTWLLAMITKNKEENLEYSKQIAQVLYDYRSDTKGKTERKNRVEIDILQAKSKKMFLSALSDVVKDMDKSMIDYILELRDRVHLMGNEDFGYFLVLLKFDYAYIERNSNK